MVDTCYNLSRRVLLHHMSTNLAGEVCHGVIKTCKRLLCGEELVDVLHHIQVRLKRFKSKSLCPPLPFDT